MRAQTYFFLLLAGILIFAASASAVTIKSGTTGNTTSSGSYATFNIRNLSFVNATVNPANIIFRGVFYTQTGGPYNRVVNFNITSIVNHSRAGFRLDSGGLPYIESGDTNKINIKSNVSNPINATIRNISVESCSGLTVLKYTSFNGIYSKNINTSSYYCSNNALTVNISGIEFTGADVNNLNILEFTYGGTTEQSAGGGSSGGGGSTSSSTISTFSIGGTFSGDLFLCNATYDYILKNGQNDITGLNTFINNLNFIYNKSYSFTEIKSYIDGWQGICSEELKKTVQPVFVCKKIYNFLLDTEGNYTYSQILQLTNQISGTQQISSGLTEYFVKNYDRSCLSYTSLKLPDKVIQTLSQKAVLEPQEECKVEINGFMDAYMPIPWAIRGDYSCGTVEGMKYLLAYDRVGGDYAIVGLKLWWMVTIFGILVIIGTFNLISYIRAKKKLLKK